MSETLFTEKEISTSPWEHFLDSTKSYKPRLIDVWAMMFKEWKRIYQSFRDLEQKSMYQNKPDGIDQNTLRAHRHGISFISGRGEELAAILEKIKDEMSKDEQDEASNYQLKIGTLLESLRESMELWHPANKGNNKSGFDNLFEQ